MSEKFRGYSIWIDTKGYPCIWINSKNVRLHVFVWEELNGEKPKGLQLHHIDGDKKNYCLENLTLVTQSDHFRIHAGWIKEGEKWNKKPCNGCNKILLLDNFYPRKGLTPSALCKSCHNKQVIKKRNTPEGKIKRREYMKIWSRRWRAKQK